MPSVGLLPRRSPEPDAENLTPDQAAESALIDPDPPEDMDLARAGQHFVVFVEDVEQVIIIDF